MSSLARAGPARSASRCGPPIDGVRPTTISTSPNFARSLASRMSHASAISKAAVRQRPCAAKTVGSGSSSILWMTSSSSSHSAPPRCGRHAVEDLADVDATGDDLALGPDQQAARRVGGDLVDRCAHALEDRVVEEVQRRAVEGQDGQRALLLQADDVGHE